MKTAWKFLILWKVLSIASAFDDGGFLFTAPRTFLSGYDENVCITFRDQSKSVQVRVAILEQKKENEIASAVEEVTDRDSGEKCFKISIPRTKIKKGRLQLTLRLKTEEDFRTNYVEQISIQTNPDVTFIQTDKPIYNGGHIVRFRIFTVRSDLTPDLQPVDRIWIENPNGIHLGQWLNESTYKGFINKTFQLSNEPLPGKWFIKMKKKYDEIVTQSFLVENYVLPKFSVTIKPSGFDNLFARNVTICAKYTFGEPVHGHVILHYFVKCSFFYYCQESASLVSRKLRLASDGCVNHEIVLKSMTSFAKNLLLNATVVEDGTQIKVKASSQIEIRTPKKRTTPEFSAATKKRKFKPGLPFKGQVEIKDQMGIDDRVLVCLYINGIKTCNDFSVRQNVEDFVILPVTVRDEENFEAFLEVKSLKNNPGESSVVKLNLVPWYSPSASYLTLENLSVEPLKCGQKARINVLYTAPNFSFPPQFHYMVKARGDILFKTTLHKFSSYSKLVDVRKNANVINGGDLRRVMEFQFYIDVTFVMSPHSYLLVYFIGKDGEVVADTLPLFVEKCMPNKVKTKWAKNVILPGSANNFSIETSSNSVCALTVSDKSTKLMSNAGYFRKDKVFKEIEKFETKSTTSDSNGNRCRDKQEWIKEPSADKIMAFSAPQESDSRFVDSLKAFNDFGALVITNLKLETRPCRVEVTYGNATTRSSHVTVRGEIENISVFEAEEFPDNQQPDLRENPLAYEIRSFFPETWIWDLVHINTSGTVNLNFEVPHTLTEWTAETVCLSSTNGLGISDSSKLVTYQPFFLDFAVPYSLKRREIFHLQVSAFNYEPFDLPVKITLGPSESFVSNSKESHSYCIKSKSKIVHRFVLEPIQPGETEIMVKAEIDFGFAGACGNPGIERSDVVVKKTRVMDEGFPVEEVKSGFICGDSSHFDHQVAWNMKIPADVVESSISLEVFVSGDILGPSLKNVDHLITLPTGCGEQNMILLVPNVLLLDYLLLTRSDELELIERALKNLDLGYQRQLNYKRADGSYSAFGEQDEKGSIWLTAFVVKYLSQAKKYIYVDEKDLNASVAWIMKHQLENGCFPMIGKIYHRKLQERLMEEDSSKTLTAHILISLIEAGFSIDNPVIKNGIYCLKPTEESLGVYGDLLSSYALILAGEYRDSQALIMELLKDARRSYGMLWWENEDSIESSIEMTSYGILSLIKLGGPLYLAAASDAIRWIIQHENKNGGFVSSQDTVLALEAISKFSSVLPRTSDHDELLVHMHSMAGTRVFNINNLNRMVQQKINLPPYLTGVRFESSGRGCALVQTGLKYNVRRAQPNDYLKIQLRIQSVSTVDLYSVARFHICIRYKSLQEKINMAVLEVSMVSGYFPDRSSLYEIRTSRRGVRRWEEYEDKVNFYFEDLRNRKVCVAFLVTQEACVENATPALIKLYDYYNTQHQTSVKYNLTRECRGNSLLDTPPSQINKVSKRDVNSPKNQKVHVPSYQDNSLVGTNFQGFTNIEQDLETPNEGGGVPLVFALPPNMNKKGPNCPHCLNKVSHFFSNLYCSSQIAVKVWILSKDTLELRMDVSPRKNFIPLKKTVSFTTGENCDCQYTVNSFALLLVTPPRSFGVQYLQELHMDDSIQLYPWGDPYSMPQYLADAIKYCNRWPMNYEYRK